GGRRPPRTCCPSVGILRSRSASRGRAGPGTDRAGGAPEAGGGPPAGTGRRPSGLPTGHPPALGRRHVPGWDRPRPKTLHGDRVAVARMTAKPPPVSTVYLGQYTREHANAIAGELEHAGIVWWYKDPGFLSRLWEYGVRMFV